MFVRRRGYNADEAQDLTQGFFLHLLNHKTLRQVNPIKGKFRSFLAASLQNYLSDQLDRAHRLKRGGNIDFVSIDAKGAEHQPQVAAPDVPTADKIFDARWAMALLNEAMTRLSGEYAGQGKTAIFETLKPFLDPINSKVSLVLRASGGEPSGECGSGQVTHSSPAQAILLPFARRGESHCE